MAYVECKIWPFSDEISHLEARNKAMKAGHRHYTVNALIDTTSDENFISESLVKKLGIDYFKHEAKGARETFGTIFDLDISFRYKGKERLVSKSDTGLNDFEVAKCPYLKADLILGLSWLWLREAKIDMIKKGIRIYGNFVPFCEFGSEAVSDPETESSESDLSDSDYAICKAPISPIKKKKSSNKGVKPRRNPTRAVRSVDHQP